MVILSVERMKESYQLLIFQNLIKEISYIINIDVVNAGKYCANSEQMLWLKVIVIFQLLLKHLQLRMYKLKVYRRRQEEIKDSCSYMNMEEFFYFQICISIKIYTYIQIHTYLIKLALLSVILKGKIFVTVHAVQKIILLILRNFVY